jgi:4-hydroxybenzoate-CoA ligase
MRGTREITMEATQGNAAYYFVDRHLGGPAGDKAAYIEAGPGGRTLTYDLLALQSDRMAALYERHGLEPGDRAAMLVRNQLEFPIIFWGSLKAGIVPVPLGTLLKPGECRAILEETRARALFVSSELVSNIEPVLSQCPDLEAVFVIEKRNDKRSNSLLGRLMAAKYSGKNKFSMPFSVELTTSRQQPMRDASPDACACWLYCREPGGKLKGTMLMHSSLQHTVNRYAAQVVHIWPDDVVFSSERMSHASGLVNTMTCPLSVGATAILVPAWPSPENALAVFREKRPTVVCAEPAVYANILTCLRKRPEGADGLRFCIAVGEAVPADIVERWREIFGVGIVNCNEFQFDAQEMQAERAGQLLHA